MKKYFLFILASIFLFQIANSQTKYTISGYVKDAKNGEAFIGVTVYKKNSQLGTVTNPTVFIP